MNNENDDWLVRVAAEEAGTATQLGPYAHFNLRNFLYDDYLDLEEVFVNYKAESETLLRTVARHFAQNKETMVQNKVVAVVGQSGSGKTSFVQHLLRKLDKNAERLPQMKEVNFMLSFGGRIADVKSIKHILPSRNLSLRGGIIFLDDAQYCYYPFIKSSEGNFLKDLISQVNSSVVITTWNVFGWKYVLSLHPDMINLFDEIIWLDGLDSDLMDELMRKRLNRYKLADSFNFDNVFNAAGLKLAEKAALQNPRLFIYLVSRAVILAHDKDANSVSEEIFKEATAKVDVPAEAVKLMNDKVIFYLLSSPSIRVDELKKFVNMERSTIQKKLQDLCKQKIVRVHEHGEGEPHAKGKYYTLNDSLQVRMEQILGEEVKAGIHRFRFSKEKGEKM